MTQDRVAKYLRRFHLASTVIWVLLIIPTVIWWKNSIVWIALMSAYALVQAHFASYMAGRSEKREMENQNA